MKISYDYQIFGWQQYGGISRYFFELANNIALNNDFDVTLVSPLFVNAYLESASEELSIIGRRMPAIRRTGRIYRALNQLLAPSIMRTISPDIVHETYYSISSRAPKRSKVVLTVFDMIHERFPASFATWDSTSREKAAAVKRADHVICISENTRRDLIEILDIEPERTSVVYLGFTLTNDTVLTKSKVDRPYFLFVGSRGGYKNFEALLRAFASESVLRNEFDLIAFGGGPFNARERGLMSELGIPDGCVQQVGGNDSKLADLYRGAEMFVYPSLYEGFGIPPLEAMSFDCPVACSNSSSIPEVVADAAILFDPYSVESIRKAMLNLIEDKDLRNRLIARGRARVQVFSWKRCADQTAGIYRSLLS